MSDVKTTPEGNESLYYSLTDVQKILGIGRSSVYSLLKEEGFPKTKILRTWLVPKAEFHKWLSEKTTSAKIE